MGLILVQGISLDSILMWVGPRESDSPMVYKHHSRDKVFTFGFSGKGLEHLGLRPPKIG